MLSSNRAEWGSNLGYSDLSVNKGENMKLIDDRFTLALGCFVIVLVTYVCFFAIPANAGQTHCPENVDCTNLVMDNYLWENVSLVSPEPTTLTFHHGGGKYIAFKFKGDRLTVEYSDGLRPDEAAQLFFDHLSKIIVKEKP